MKQTDTSPVYLGFLAIKLMRESIRVSQVYREEMRCRYLI